MSKCAFNKKNPNVELEDVLIDLCELVGESNEDREKKALFIKGLEDLGGGYESTSLSDLSDFIKEYVKTNYPDLSYIVPVNTDIYLASKSGNIDEEVQEENSKTSLLDAPDAVEETDVLQRGFISKAYGTATEVQRAMERELSRNIVNSFIVNRDKGIVIDSTATLNSEVRAYQNNLLQNVVSFLQDRYSKTKSSKYDVDGIMKDLNGLEMYKDGMYTDAVAKVTTLATPFLDSTKLTADVLNTYYSEALSKYKPSEQFITAYNSLVILNNFDALLKLNLGKVLSITPGTFNKFTLDNKYSLTGNEANNIVTWRTNEDINPEEEIDDITRLLVETSKVYMWQNNSPLSNRFMGLQEFNYITSKLKDIVNNSASRELRFDGVFFNSFPELSKYRSYLQGRTLYDLIALIRRNPQKNLPIISEMVTNPRFFSTYSSTIFKEFYRPDMDILYSLHKNILEDSQSSLYGIMLRNKGKSNYFAYITQTVDSISAIKYAQYFEDESGNITMRTLKDSSANVVKMRVENKINGMLSRVAPIRYEELTSKYNASYVSGIFTLEIPNTNLSIKFDPKANRGKAFDVYRVTDGIPVKIVNFEGKSDWDNLIDYFNDFLKVDFTPSSSYMKNYLSLKTLGENIQYGSATSDLFQFATSVFFNSYFSHNLVYPNMDWDKFNEVIGTVYGDANKPQFIRSAEEISLVSKAYISVLSDLANATSMTTGSFTSSVVRDGNGDSLASTTITRLFDAYPVQWVTQCMYGIKSATKTLGLLNNPKLLNGIITSREFKRRDSTKAHSSFNVAESYSSSLIYDYVGGLVNHDEGTSRVQGSGFMPAVNSDKSTILKMLVNMNEMSPAKKAYSQLTKDEVRGLVNSEIGTAYGKIMDNILNTFAELNRFAASTGNHVSINPLTNFAEFNAFYGKGAAAQLLSLVKAYNDTHITGILELRDQVHFYSKGGSVIFNRSLISLTNRFNPNYFKSKNIDATAVFGKLTSAADFWDLKERELLSGALDNNFMIETTDSAGRPLMSPEIQYFAKMSSWVYPTTKRVILAKYTPEGGTTINISKWSDFGEASYTEKDRFGRDVVYTHSTDGFDISKLKGKVELHPTLGTHNALDYLLTQEFMLTTVGTHISHPAKGAVTDPSDLVEEAARYVAQIKRNVSFTASMHVFQQGMLNGIPLKYNIAVIEDLDATVFNIMGYIDPRGAKPYDGATFVDPFIVHLENFSLCGSKAGIDKKQFVHAYKEDTCTGIIIKTAGFGLTNDRISNSHFYRRMMKKMTDRVWRDHMGNPYIADITKNYAGGTIPYDTMYYKGTDGKFYMINSITSNGDATYSIIKSQVEPDGTIVKELPLEITGPITTNYALWNMFGGMNSRSLKNGELVPSEVSITNVVKAMNNIGVVLNQDGAVNTQDDIYQVLKMSDIHYVPTAGAVKQGAANINSPAFYTNEDSYNIMELSMNHAGIQLDASHSADEANLSIMTQVLSSLSSRGYTANLAQEVYDALSGLTEYGIKEYIDSYNQYLDSGSPEQFQNVIVKTVVKAMLNSTSRDSNIAQAIAETLIEKAKAGKELTFKDTQGVIPYSDPSVFNQLVSVITASLTKSAIRIKFPGTLSVLNPSHGIWKLYGDRKLESFNNPTELDNLQKLYDTKPLSSVSEIKLGRTYNITVDGTTTSRLIETPQQYWDLKNELIGREASIVENVVEGRDLATYGIQFKDINGVAYNMWDLDIVKSMYSFRSGIEAISKAKDDTARVQALATMREWLQSLNLNTDFKLAYKQLQESLQKVLGVFGSIDDTVYVNGQPIQIDKKSIDISPYETIMPKIYMSKFGLTQYDDLSTIKNDTLFFFKKMLSNWQSKVDDNDFDVELKRLNGNHTYLINRDTFKPTRTLMPAEIEKIWDGNKLYRRGPRGEKMYRLAAESDQVYTDAAGNEIIVTDNLGFYVESNSFHTLRVSDSAAKSDHLEAIMLPIKLSVGKVAKRFYQRISKGDIATNILETNLAYRSSLDSIQKNPNKAITDPRVKMIYEQSQEIYTSFMKSLDVLAARIPSQTMQSFMPMRVVAFDNPDVNSAYVNYWQIWLQGSDFDIDKVSMLGYSFDRTGKYIGWSPYFNISSIENLKSSETLPFPSGKALDIVPTDDTSLTNWGNDYVGSGKLFNFNGDDVIFLHEFDDSNELGTVQMLAGFLRMIRQNDGKLYVPNNSTLPFNKIADIINRHNMYLGSLKGDTGMDMIRNFISSYMYKISSDPINLVQSQSPTDLGDPQKAASNSSAGRIVKTFTPGNTLNKHISLFENMAGKEVIGITAAGMKIFFALTQYYNITLKEGSDQKQNYLLFDKQIGGQHTSLLANSYTNDPLSSVKDPSVYDAVIKVDNTRDAALVLSALLSCATDNAKELVLSKINAGADMVGLYIYGTSIGIEFSEIAKVMMSRTAKAISRIKNGNIFNSNEGIPFITGVFDYLDKGPDVSHLDPEFLGELSNLLGNESLATASEVRKLLARFMHDTIGTNFNLSKKLALVEKLKKVANTIDSNAAKISSFKFIDTLEEYISNVQIVRDDYVKGLDGNMFYAYDAIKDLYYGGAELRRLGTILGLNQGLKTKVDRKLKFIRDFENLFTDRFGEFDKDDEIRARQLAAPVTLNGESTTLGNVFARLENLVKDDNMDTNGVVLENDKYKISFTRFVNDSTYRNTVIDLYNGVKHTFNIIDVIWTLPHYRGYLKTAFMDYVSQRELSSKFRAIDDLGGKVISKYGFKSSKDVQGVYRGVQAFLDNTLVNSWMRTSNKEAVVQEGVTIFNRANKEFTTEEDTPILLGTPSGNASFKKWMESTVIPDLKNGILSKKGKIIMENRFIKDLTPLRIDKTATKRATFIYTLPINMIPRSDEEKSAYMMYRSEFNKLQSLRYYNHPVSDLFFYYNLINFRNATTQSSLTPMFEELLRNKTSPLLEEYNRYVSEFDTKSNLLRDIDYTQEDVLMWCAPVMDTNKARTPYTYAYDYSSMSMKLYKRVRAERGSQSDDADIDADFYDYNIDFDYDSGFSDYDDNGTSINTRLLPNKNYQAVEDSRDSRYFLTREESNRPKNVLRLSASVLLSIDRNAISEVKYNGKNFTRAELLDKLKALEGSEEDLEIPYVTKRIAGVNETLVDNSTMLQLLDHIFKNPC